MSVVTPNKLKQHPVTIWITLGKWYNLYNNIVIVIHTAIWECLQYNTARICRENSSRNS